MVTLSHIRGTELNKMSNHWQADLYSANSEFQYNVAKALMQSHAFLSTDVILDIGCGHGRLTYELAQLVPKGRVIGIDTSRSMIEYAKANYVNDNLSFLEMNAENLNFPHEKFNVIFSSFCIQWIPNKAKLFQAMAQHLEENGHILLVMPLPNQKMLEIRKKVYASQEWKDIFQNKTSNATYTMTSDYEKLASDAGFLNINFYLKDVTICFENVEKFKLFIKTISPSVSQLPNDFLKEKLLNQVIESYAEYMPPLADGSYQLTYTTATLIAHGISNTYH